MTNGEKLQELFPDLEIEIYWEVVKAYEWKFHIVADKKWWNTEYKEPTTTIDYRRAFKIACDLLNGDILYGVDTNDIYELMMQKDSVVSSSSYEEYILNHLQELDQGQYASGSENLDKSEFLIGSTTKNNLGVDCISRTSALDSINWAYNLSDAYQKINDLPPVTPIRAKGHWILTDIEGYKVWHCHCSECNKDPQDYIGGSENWWLIMSKLPKFCPNCGSDNREVEE